jgi:hypothetical protein
MPAEPRNGANDWVDLRPVGPDRYQPALSVI